ncbi:MAG: DUF2914 domain-containing protein [Gracilimonas sp.]|uniref:DUF2914 domain-containing protein n=1 Tax=Gracilimonas sp. TaxID=1974203 RepID=UPI001B105F44|nr:DUF2914 domain-containing protein [Gracilimonas sp.]MBO6584874.1 DUF2914 domain-containing protein [Gracilimonas sp.]MBO6615855.1 DUF2914 domain-containing protein [Gracilimonas sp.]
MINRFRDFVRANQRYLPVVFFMAGFVWDSLTLGRIDRLYDRIILCTYLSSLTVCLYLFNLADDGKWEGTFFEKYQDYLPLAIQFFLGGLCSAYVIYFSRSVSFSKTVIFFIILVVLLFANELLKKRISNKYLQFSAYFFVNFTFFTFFVPMVVGTINQFIFMLSGAISLGITLGLIIYIYNVSPSTRKEISFGKMLGFIFGIYLLIHTFYFFNLIPPVPLALDEGLVAHHVERSDDTYVVTYEREPWYKIWKDNRHQFEYEPGSNVYVFTSIFAPSDFRKDVLHRWKWYSPHTNNWEVIDEIGFEITGGRDEGFRGYTYKNKMMEGEWKVDVITKEGLVLGIISFEIDIDSTAQPYRLSSRTF